MVRYHKMHTPLIIVIMAFESTNLASAATKTCLLEAVDNLNRTSSPKLITPKEFWKNDGWAHISSHEVRQGKSDRGPEYVRLEIDNTNRAAIKGIGQRSGDHELYSLWDWERLPLSERDNTNMTGLATQTTPLPTVLQVDVKPGQTVTVVYETPRSTLTEFERTFSRKEYRQRYQHPPREFRFVRGKVQNDGTILALEGNTELVGKNQANLGRIEAILIPGDLLELEFETQTTVSNRELDSRWQKDPRTSGKPYTPHSTAEVIPYKFSGQVRDDGSLDMTTDHAGDHRVFKINSSDTLSWRTPLQDVRVRGQQKARYKDQPLIDAN